MNLLSDPVFDTRPLGRLSLPGILAAMARDELRGFPALRAHQRAAWHCFLVQLGALALHRAGLADPPRDEGGWRDLLSALAGGEAPWALFAPADQPAFMQPPAPPGLTWKPVETPDALDLLINSRNHDLKAGVGREVEAQDWIFALVSLQTSEGYGGKTNYGIARMRSGHGSRALLAFIPDPEGSGLIDPARWWRRDIAALIDLRASGHEAAIGLPGGDALLWCLPWTEGRQLDMTRLDPWFIEVCRRIRLIDRNGTILAERAGSKALRIAGGMFNGVTGDPWAPVKLGDPETPLTIGEGHFTYKLMCDLLFSAVWRRPPIFGPQPGEDAGLILAEALGRGENRTDGLKSRIIPVPPGVVDKLHEPGTAKLVKALMDEIEVFDTALKCGLATAAGNGDDPDDKELSKAERKRRVRRSEPARDAYDAQADRLFFPGLWDRVTAAADSPQAEEVAQHRFLMSLADAARAEFAAALPAIPCRSIRRPRAEVRARRAFDRVLRQSEWGVPLGLRKAAEAA